MMQRKCSKICHYLPSRGEGIKLQNGNFHPFYIFSTLMASLVKIIKSYPAWMVRTDLSHLACEALTTPLPLM